MGKNSEENFKDIRTNLTIAFCMMEIPVISFLVIFRLLDSFSGVILAFIMSIIAITSLGMSSYFFSGVIIAILKEIKR